MSHIACHCVPSHQSFISHPHVSVARLQEVSAKAIEMENACNIQAKASRFSDNHRVAEKRREEKRTEQTAIEQDRRQHNRTELKNRTETGATERGIIHLSAHVSQDSSSF